MEKQEVDITYNELDKNNDWSNDIQAEEIFKELAVLKVELVY